MYECTIPVKFSFHFQDYVVIGFPRNLSNNKKKNFEISFEYILQFMVCTFLFKSDRSYYFRVERENEPSKYWTATQSNICCYCDFAEVTSVMSNYYHCVAYLCHMLHPKLYKFRNMANTPGRLMQLDERFCYFLLKKHLCLCVRVPNIIPYPASMAKAIVLIRSALLFY